MSPRATALEQERVAGRVVLEELHGPVSSPTLESSSLLLALPVRPLDLQHGVAGGNDDRDVAVLEGLLQLEAPLLHTLLEQLRHRLEPGWI